MYKNDHQMLLLVRIIELIQFVSIELIANQSFLLTLYKEDIRLLHLSSVICAIT